ncbi:MAG: hypothetical protein NAG76_02095 [Candidatus Pristimantibacillus lignocellulolyticus]|uniref:Uncharacterized protein n=1 Tax=Candidatus Pristimantibacillus lignocellulolyticus TaxID=2994561 RepID=A0A9J6ZGS8_9BACL|nr:MAG: hypothetical protein NAG76_02095 [Candidatus Pristimantibacillus lignocellulolyticus]
MGIFDRFMGRSRNRELISELEQLSESYNREVSSLVHIINSIYTQFNLHIEEVNDIRIASWEQNIEPIQKFLSYFGDAQLTSDYVPEEIKVMVKRPQSEFEKLDQYIVDNDFSDKSMFFESILKSPLYVSWRNKKANDKIELNITTLATQFEQVIHELSLKKEVSELETKICQLYIETVRFIITFISERIVPELQFILSFFQAEALKDMIMSNQQVEKVAFDYNIHLLQDTIYQKHYQFIRNAFFFYVISCKFYNTPVLTKLLTHSAHSEDIIELDQYKLMIETQAQQLEKDIFIKSS